MKLLEEPAGVARLSGLLQTGMASCGGVTLLFGLVGVFSLRDMSLSGWCLAGIIMLSLAVFVSRQRDREMKMLRELARLQEEKLCAADDAFGYDNVANAWKKRRS